MRTGHYPDERWEDGEKVRVIRTPDNPHKMTGYGMVTYVYRLNSPIQIGKS